MLEKASIGMEMHAIIKTYPNPGLPTIEDSSSAKRDMIPHKNKDSIKLLQKATLTLCSRSS